MKTVPYNSSLKQEVFDFTDRCFAELGKRFEPEGRHFFYNDIGKNFEVFLCLIDEDKAVEFDGFRKEAGLNAFTMSPTKWMDIVFYEKD